MLRLLSISRFERNHTTSFSHALTLVPFTEKMDYFSAMAAILTGFLLAIHRVFHVQLYSTISRALMLLAIVFFIFHVSYLSFYKFDYGYNIIAGVFGY
jgi:post-GPI attachment to proteins factor 3